MKDLLEPLRVIIQLGALVVVATLVPMMAGIWFDKRFGTFPWAICLSGVVALILSVALVYKVTQPLYERAHKDRPSREREKG